MSKSWSELIKEEISDYPLEKFNFRAIMQKILEHEDLENIHLSNPEMDINGKLEFESDQSTYFHRKFYNSPHLPEFESLYEGFVRVNF